MLLLPAHIPLISQICSKCNINKPINEYYFRKEKQEYRLDCKECISKQKKIYSNLHKKEKQKYNYTYIRKNRAKFRDYKRMRRKNNINCHLRTKYSNNINKLLKINNIIKQESNYELLGCTIDEFRKHLERQFTDNMNWNNHGFGKDKWHIDHIIPCSFFNLNDVTERKICFHFSNQQPLWQNINLSKSNKILNSNLLNN